MPALGFAVVALVLAPLIALVLRRRWWLASVRQAEVTRLALLAAEEAQRAEEEAFRVGRVRPVVDGVGAGTRTASVCVVCRSHTTTRCSRCKAVKYCSGKCQIIHWRQGHKNQCFPPKIGDHYSGQIGTTKMKGRIDDASELYDDSLDSGGICQEEVMTLSRKLSLKSKFSAEDFSEDEFMDSSGTESTSDSSSSTSSIFSAPVGLFDDTCPTSYPSLHQKTEIEKHLSIKIQKKAPSYAAEEAVRHPSVPKLIRSESSTFEESKQNGGKCKNIMVSSSMPQSATLFDSMESKLNEENQHNHTRSDVQASSKPHDEVILSQTEIINEKNSSTYSLSGVAQTVSASEIASFGESATLTRSKSYGGRLVEPKSFMYLSPASVNQSSHACHFASDDNAPIAPLKLHQNAGPHSGNQKISGQKVVQQLKLSKISRQYRPSFENELPKKPKMLFSFEYFVKLYNFDGILLHPTGLMNLRNSCYANVVLQCLAFTQPLAAYLLQGLHSRTCPKRKWCFTCELENLLINAKLGQSPLSPASILSHIHKMGNLLGHGREEDAHEFLRYAIDAMQSVYLKDTEAHAVSLGAEETAFVRLTFGGYLQSKIECMKCHNKSEQLECMMDLIVEIEGNIGSLEEALLKFTTTEILDGENKYKCPRCKTYEQAKKKLTIVDAPNILTVVLKRFQSGKFGKLNKAVRFTEYLDLAPYTSGSTDKSLGLGYNLYAVVVHLDVMNAAFSGHYVCYVKSRRGKWYLTDDSMVRLVELEQVLSENAYMLLYARCSPHSPSLLSGTFSPDQVGSSRSRSKVLCSGWDREKSGSNAVTVVHDPTDGRKRYREEPNRPIEHHFNAEPYSLLNALFHVPDTDTASDSSSLFSYSDEGSCSTESTRNSTSTDECSDYLFGDLDRHSWYSPLRISSDGAGSLRVPGADQKFFVPAGTEKRAVQML